MTIIFRHRVVRESDPFDDLPDIPVQLFGSFAEAERTGCRACGAAFDSLNAMVRRNTWVNQCVACGEFTWYRVEYFHQGRRNT